MELWDLYTKDRIPLGITMERGGVQPPNTYRIVVKICIFNSKGQMLCQHRLPTKKPYANMWEMSASGSVIAGETSAQGACREALEEIGLTLPQNIRPIVTTHTPNVFEDLYVFQMDVNPSQCKLQPTEVDDIAYFDEQQILQMIDDGAFIPFRKEMIGVLFAMRNKRQFLMDREER